jgi:uncharacterized coiled-coil DUF342 family protein
MDRHQYVEKLIKERDNLEKEISGCRAEVSSLKKRTKEYILGWKGELTNLTVSGLSGWSVTGTTSYGEVKFPENERVSDEAIKDLHKQILELENIRRELKEEISNLMGQDFLSFLRNLIKE